VITEAELQYGVALSPQPARDETALQAFLLHVDVLDFSRSAAAHYARIRADLKSSGRMIGANDLLIAAHARSLDIVLVTNRTGEFRRVESLALENWAA
jgi:tRNA(fMet)-specific endonuclease VapC